MNTLKVTDMKKGYDISFLGQELSLPEFDAITKQLPDSILLDYTNFSVFYSKERRMPIYTVVNIDGMNFEQIDRDSDNWKYDERLSENEQLGDNFYERTNRNFHRGHVVRRLDPCWGSNAEEAEEDTFHFTNAIPQHMNFNPKIWLELERSILEKGAVENDQKITVFSGPVLSQIDKPFVEKIDGELIFIPTHFWKVIVWKKKDKGLFAVGFMQSQKDLINKLVNQNFGRAITRGGEDDDYYENIKFKKNAAYQVSIKIIEKLSGLNFNFKDVNLPNVENDILELQIKTDYEDAEIKGRYRGNTKNGLACSIEGLKLE